MDLLAPLTSLRPLAALVTVLAVAGATGCAVGDAAPPVCRHLRRRHPPAPHRRRSPSGSARWSPSLLGASSCPTATGSASARSAPRRNGLLDVPDDIELAGWWSGGSRLGDPFGSTLVAAHVDSRTQGLGPFASLLEVHAGDRVHVWSDGLRQAFEVTSLRLRPQGTIGPGS